MYHRILLALDNTAADETLLTHIRELVTLLKSELIALHVADGWVARNFEQLQLSSSEEMRDDWEYLEKVAARLREETNLEVRPLLALGNPPEQILKVAANEKCDLIIMTSHGHKILGDILYGSTIESVRHQASVAILVIPAQGNASPSQIPHTP